MQAGLHQCHWVAAYGHAQLAPSRSRHVGRGHGQQTTIPNIFLATGCQFRTLSRSRRGVNVKAIAEDSRDSSSEDSSTFTPCSPLPLTADNGALLYAESSRKYRRTVYRYG